MATCRIFYGVCGSTVPQKDRLRLPIILSHLLIICYFMTILVPAQLVLQGRPLDWGVDLFA